MNNYIEDVNHKINKFDLLNIYRTIKQMTAEYMFFSSMHVVLIKFTKCWVIKTSFNKFHNIDNKQSVILWPQWNSVRNQKQKDN